MKKQKYVTIDGNNLVIESVTTGKLSKDRMNTFAMIIAQSYKNRRCNNDE